jgi:lipopolysaccharide transport system ATP-binding protein
MGFHPDFTGRQNAYMGGQLLGYTPDELRRFMPEIEAFADIGHYIDQPMRIYSSGMQVRLAFAVATARRPDLLIVDEALSVGDAHFQHKSFGRIREFQERGTTLLLVSHDLAAIRSLCNRTVWLDRGVMKACDDTRSVVDAYAASVYSHKQDIGKVKPSPAVEAPAPDVRPASPGVSIPGEDVRDCRQDLLNSSAFRNDIRVFVFDRTANRWGNGDVRITNACLQDEMGQTLHWVLGGEKAHVVVDARASVEKTSILIGFIVKDRTGQALFGDNNYLRYADRPVSAKAGTAIRAEFTFRMPVLPRGTYVLAVAVAAGTQDDHVVEEWVDEALFFESHNANTVQGLIGLPMHDIRVTVSPAQTGIAADEAR